MTERKTFTEWHDWLTHKEVTPPLWAYGIPNVPLKGSGTLQDPYVLTGSDNFNPIGLIELII